MIQIFSLALILALFLILLNSVISSKSFNDREKPSSFECGFNPLFFSRTPFSTQFFLIAVIFLIFDVEITLILPIPMILHISSSNSLIVLATFFLIILILGLFYEWKNGALYWPK
uniref:NADH-ubiquinone oxidoreductase chain 3 n=1 Tax=Onychiurus orientalis TaxID=280588 RepID=Q6DVH4_ONYOR|nr:NADH dehydrogenase subunit 3 [Onychiurus orientalis]AAT69325.1 NADH dehydrogenase subunit 3 [Onychiurus orientalis]